MLLDPSSFWSSIIVTVVVFLRQRRHCEIEEREWGAVSAETWLYLTNFTNKGEQWCSIWSREILQHIGNNSKTYKSPFQTRPLRRSIDTLCVASKHSINALLVNAQLRECLTRDFIPIACIRAGKGRRRWCRAKNNAFKPERFNSGTH